MIAAEIADPAVFCNLGIICKNSGRIKEALNFYKQALDIEANDAKIYSNIGNLYREIGDLEQALQFTLKSLDLDQKSSTIQMNLGSIYQELGETDQAVTATVMAIELDPSNTEAIQNLKSLAGDIRISASNHEVVRNAYGILLNREDFAHRKLCSLFIQEFLETIQTAAQAETLITENNQALKQLATDWQFRKSLTLLIPPHQEIEEFLTRLRKEALILIQTDRAIPTYLKPLLEALATQCFLNEYVYWQSDDEQQWVDNLVNEARKDSGLLNTALPIIACYLPLDEIDARDADIQNYPLSSDESRSLIETQYNEVKLETAIQSRFKASKKTTNAISLEVQNMYEENPYPRYQYADYTHPTHAQPTGEFIALETTLPNLHFSDAISSPNSSPNILIAGCGTGNQIINASRYKNAHITAIDISQKSLAYARRKAIACNMHTVQFHQLDILNADHLQHDYDVIECSGVLHHMEDPAQGLATLNRQLKPGGYIKLGLYSELARRKVTEARQLIKHLGFQSSTEDIRRFRKAIFNGESPELKSLSTSINDFYSLSECRDLCFHVQEHQFSTETLKNLLKSEGLRFCGFMLPAATQMAYRQQFPEDKDGTSLETWGLFEQRNPSTFQSMYQFWAYKPVGKQVTP